MKLVLDEGLRLGAAAILRNAGIDAWHVTELGLGGASDETVLERVRTDGAVLVTLDADFHQILATTGASQPSVVRVRMEGLKAQVLANLLLMVIEQTRADLLAGAAVSVSGKQIRLRRLPF
jgi:predicted nuclease of predicted toxin-antitoxin system